MTEHNDLSMEKINAQRISTIEVRMEKLGTELRTQIQDLASQIFSKMDHMANKESWDWKAVAAIAAMIGLMISVTLGMAAMLQNNINFNSVSGKERSEFVLREQAKVRNFKDRVEVEILGSLVSRVEALENNTGDRYTGLDAREDREVFRDWIKRLEDKIEKQSKDNPHGL